ncbi:MAG: CDGSH iron-sulfur domain-containing protein [Methanobrevibacter sp.]|jgi:CDGSH-type Zn-finger protein|nr:CDGSH iron-sulfur domain-containing protein [Candidatus Methanovirga aequatorialis]
MKIKVTKNGPYLVSGNVPLYKIKFVVDEKGNPLGYGEKEKIETNEPYGLCRCGNSNNKPFCDGTHTKIDFDGEEVAALNVKDVYSEDIENEHIKLIDHYMYCDHSRFCLRHGGIRKLIKEDSDDANEKAKDEASNCPSGRLLIYDKETGQSTEPKFEKEINMIYDDGKHTSGPIWVKGGVPLESANGEEYIVRNRMTLCQCGKSWHKPFCNGMHWVSEEFQEKFLKRWGLD